MKRNWLFALPIIILAVGSLIHYSRGHYGLGDSAVFSDGVDDAYITYRYGWNLIHFGNLSWNESGFRQTEGFTNPLWVMVSAGLSLPGIKELVYPLSVITSVLISALLLFYLIFSVFQRNNQSAASILGLLMVCAVPPIWLHMTSGLESGVFGVGLALLAYLVIFDEHNDSIPVTIIALTLFIGFLRSDGFIYLIIILVAALIAGSRSWKAVAIGLLISSSVIFLWRYFEFGTLLPNTAVAKVNFGVLERLPIGANFLFSTIANSGLVIFLILGIAGLWLESRKIKIAGLFIILSWIAYYLYIGGDVFVERHLIGMYFLGAAFSAPLWKVAKPFTRGIFIVLVISVAVVSMFRYGNRFNYFAGKLNDPWIVLGKAIEADREEYGVVISFAAGKIPFYAGGDFIDSIGLNDPYLATLERENFIPGHSAGNEDEAIKLALTHSEGKYSIFSYLSEEIIQHPEKVRLWVDNFNPQEFAQTEFSIEEWEYAISSNNQFVWSIISKNSY
jgi:hypothetical protein